MTNGEPILGKARPDHRDGRPLTWSRFLRLRAWAQRVAPEHGVNVYLVGSALTKTHPRDVDVAVVWPAAEFVQLFGPIPPNALEESPGGPRLMSLYLHDVVVTLYQTGRASLGDISFDLRMGVRVDIHYCPDTWWPDRDRLPLALGVASC